jgi:hypothetical protein
MKWLNKIARALALGCAGHKTALKVAAESRGVEQGRGVMKAVRNGCSCWKKRPLWVATFRAIFDV